jgi:hypothetical protein
VQRPELDEALVTRSRARWRLAGQRARARVSADLDALCGIEPPRAAEVDYAETARTYQEREPARDLG